MGVVGRERVRGTLACSDERAQIGIARSALTPSPQSSAPRPRERCLRCGKALEQQRVSGTPATQFAQLGVQA